MYLALFVSYQVDGTRKLIPGSPCGLNDFRGLGIVSEFAPQTTDVGIDTAIKDGIMYWHVYFRSWSLWSGFPSNLAALQIAKEYMVGRLRDHGLEIKDGPLLASSMKLHLYEHEFDLAKMRMYLK